MEFDDVTNEDPAAEKRSSSRDLMKRNMIVAVGSEAGDVQIWNPLRANELQQYVSTSGKSSVAEADVCHYTIQH